LLAPEETAKLPAQLYPTHSGAQANATGVPVKPQPAQSRPALSQLAQASISTATAVVPIPAPVPVPAATNSRPTRPSLSDQLAAIGSSAEALTLNIKQNAGMTTVSDESDPPLFAFPTKALTIGTLSCRYPSPARFYKDRIEYTFHHPFESLEVEMHMYYRDLLQSTIVGGKLKFKLPRRLVNFLADFDPSNPNHVVSIELGGFVLTLTPRRLATLVRLNNLRLI